MYHLENKQNPDLEKLQADLEKQYGPAVAQDIIDRIGKTPTAKAPDYMDVKAMSELQERFRAQAMLAVWRLKEWRRSEKNRGFKQNLIEMEGVYLQRQCQEAIQLYRQANKSYFRMHRQAMAAIILGTAERYKVASQQA